MFLRTKNEFEARLNNQVLFSCYLSTGRRFKQGSLFWWVEHKTPQGLDCFLELSIYFSISTNLLQMVSAVFELVLLMSIKTRSSTPQHKMMNDSANSSHKLDDILSKMDVLITTKNELLKQVGYRTKYNYQGCRRPEK